MLLDRFIQPPLHALGDVGGRRLRCRRQIPISPLNRSLLGMPSQPMTRFVLPYVRERRQGCGDVSELEEYVERIPIESASRHANSKQGLQLGAEREMPAPFGNVQRL